MVYETVPGKIPMPGPAAVSDCLLCHCCDLPALAHRASLLLQQTASWPGCVQVEGHQAREWLVGGRVVRVQPGVGCRR